MIKRQGNILQLILKNSNTTQLNQLSQYLFGQYFNQNHIIWITTLSEYCQKWLGYQMYYDTSPAVYSVKCTNQLYFHQTLKNRCKYWNSTSWVEIITPAGNYIFKVNNRNIRIRCEICSKLTIKIPFWYLYC